MALLGITDGRSEWLDDTCTLSDLDDISVRTADEAGISPYLAIGSVMKSAPRLLRN